MSESLNITCAVPRDHTLNHCFFCYIYINDHPKCLEEAQASIFAEETNLSCQGTSSEEITKYSQKVIGNHTIEQIPSKKVIRNIQLRWKEHHDIQWNTGGRVHTEKLYK